MDATEPAAAAEPAPQAAAPAQASSPAEASGGGSQQTSGSPPAAKAMRKPRRGGNKTGVKLGAAGRMASCPVLDSGELEAAVNKVTSEGPPRPSVIIRSKTEEKDEMEAAVDQRDEARRVSAERAPKKMTGYEGSASCGSGLKGPAKAGPRRTSVFASKDGVGDIEAEIARAIAEADLEDA